MGIRTRWTNRTILTAALLLLGTGSDRALLADGEPAADLAPASEAAVRPAGADLTNSVAAPSERGAKVPVRVFPHTLGTATVLWDNGPFVTHPGGGGGGADASRLQNTTFGMSTLGFTAADTGALRLADDFTITDAAGWNIDTISVYCYQTNSTTTSTFDVARLQIWDGDPSAGGTVVFGDMTTNRLLSSSWTNAYRDTQTTVGNTARPIMEVVINVAGTHFDPGTYWIDFQTGGTLASGPFCVPITITGRPETGNAMQFNGTAWVPAVDTGANPDAPQGIPFVVEGTGVSGPGVTLTKTVGDVPGECAPGDSVTVTNETPVEYCFTVENTGSVALGNHTLEDDHLGTILEDLSYLLLPGESVQVLVSDVATTTVTNTATWTAWVGDQVDTVCAGAPITINVSGPATPYPSTIAVAGLPTSPSDVTVDLVDISHTFPDDVDMLLVGPGGQTLIFASDAGGTNDWVTADLTFDDAAAAPMTDAGANPTGTYRATNYGANDTFAAPAPAGPYGNGAPAGTDTFGSVFGGDDPNGNWSLYIVDDVGGDSGSVANWCVNFTSVIGITAGSDTATVTVLYPDAATDPTSLSADVQPGGTASDILTVQNNGAGDLNWSMFEGPGIVTAPVGGPVYYADRATFEADNPGLPIEDFEDTLVAPGAVLGCPAPFDASTNNACFATGTILPGLAVQDNPLNDTGGGDPNGLATLGVGFAGAASDQVVANTFVDSFELVFDPPVTAVGGELVHYTGASQTINITIFDANDVQIGSTTGTGTSGAGTFWGVFSAVPIGRVNFLSVAPAGDGAEGMDNITFGTATGCTAPEDLPWLGLSQTSGTTAPSGSTQLGLVYFAGALPEGDYAGVLCLDSNDPDTPLLEVPVSMSVSRLPFLDGFETGDTSRWDATVPN